MTVHDAGIVTRHEGRFERLETRVNALDGRVDVMEAFMGRVDADLYNHGQDGLKTLFVRFVTESRTRDSEREKALKRHNHTVATLLTVFGILVAVLTMVIAWQTYVDTHDKMQKGLLKLPFISSSEQPEMLYADRQQTSAIPPIAR